MSKIPPKGNSNDNVSPKPTKKNEKPGTNNKIEDKKPISNSKGNISEKKDKKDKNDKNDSTSKNRKG